VVQTGEPLLVPDAHADARFYAGIDEKTSFYTRAMLAVPIKIEGRTIGVVEVLNPVAGAFDQDVQRLLPAVAGLAAAAIRNAELYERVRQAERRYESLFNESSDPIVVLDLEGSILDLNSRAVEMFKRSREELICVAFWDLFTIPQEMHQATLRQLGEGKRLSLEMKSRSGEDPRTLETHMARIDYGGREAIQWVGHDVSERVALEQMREDLTHMIIHDLRNPLGSIMSSVQLIRTAFVERDTTLPVMQLLRIAIRSGEKMFRLIDSLLDLGRLEAGDAELKKTPVSLALLCREVMEPIQPLALNRRQTLAVQIAPGLPRVPADRDLILRVLTNLLDNAIKFTPEEGQVTLSVEQAGQEMLFTVSDTGPGIRPENRQRVFDRFARLEKTGGLKGTGLGLTFCKLVVEAHGGCIWVESKVGEGSHFKFTLPLEAE